ncbi:acyl-CoA dehydrogenase family protein [Bacillus sp. ISL-55]|uniref:acyl-CoA dehydrogenase family protein n=1 Tax=Bacillus sp. ISL-55 TaxID=2819134 RepID=UPI001BE83539|nr:acyl-CoA dehydrogenase family protein [Bacillus sp. ISL-55]MBT2695752.1 acyl-CoA dehydrogenase family protein [Bacillus sp. ISL-55]
MKSLEVLIQEQLKPFVRKIDAEAYYAEEFLKSIGKAGLLNSKAGVDYSTEVRVVEEVSKVCMTTAFNLWCHLASLTYIRNSDNSYLKEEILPQLESGQVLGGTGLSNPMKYYAGLEALHLKAAKTNKGYTVNGQLPSVSNLGKDHWFGIIAEVSPDQRMMAVVPCNAEGLILKAKLEYLGVNGSATYSCAFDEVTIPEKWIVSHDVDSFIVKIRPAFVLYQIPLGLGVTEASIRSIRQVCNKQGGCNDFLPIQPAELEKELEQTRTEVYKLADGQELLQQWKHLLQLRLRTAYLTAKAAHGSMLHQGGAGYLKYSAPSRRLRESYFLLNLTPTVKHLEKMLQSK